MENKLQRLASQFRDQPNQTLLRQRKVQLSTIANRIEVSLEEVREARQRVAALRDVLEEPGLLAETVTKQLTIIKQSAQRLTTQVASTAVSEASKVNGPLQTVTDAATGLREAVSNEWASAASGEVQSAQAFVALAGAYDIEAQRGLQGALDRFRRSIQSPPTSSAAMLEYRASRKALIAARDALQISGPVAEFLLGATKGEGSARALGSKEVQEFLNQHPVLWTRLRVNLT